MSYIPSSPQNVGDNAGLLPAFKPSPPSSGSSIKIHHDANSNDNTPPCSSPPMRYMSEAEDDEDDRIDDEIPQKFSKQTRQTHQTHYPTPAPSSSLGIGSSSPPRAPVSSAVVPVGPVGPGSSTSSSSQPKFASLKEQTRSFVVRSPLSTVAMVRVPKDGSEIRIGRSSKSCQVALSSKNRLVSRVHARVWYDAERKCVVTKCEGWNGLKVSVPDYGEEDDTIDISKGYPAALGHDEYEVYEGEMIEVLYVPGITVDVRGERALIEVVEDGTNDDTEDELTEKHAHLPHDKLVTGAIEKLQQQASSKKSLEEDSVEQESAQRAEQQAPENHEAKTTDAAVVVPPSPSPPQTKPQAEPAPTQPTQPQQSKPQMKESLPAAVNTNTTSTTNIVTNTNKSNTTGPVPAKEKAQSKKRSYVEHSENKENKHNKHHNEQQQQQQPKKKKIKTESVKDEFRQLDEEELANVKHIVANHLAFSRLAQTPISVVQKSNNMLSTIPKAQLRGILQNIDCVGIIQRSGKDAAGKPLEEEYYYDVSQDSDEHRLTLVQQMRGGGSLRSCRKTHKQYFWKRPNLR